MTSGLQARASNYRCVSHFCIVGFHIKSELPTFADPVHVGRASALDPILEQVILTVRLLTNWNSRRIVAEFGRRGVTVGHGQIDRPFARHGTHQASVMHERTSMKAAVELCGDRRLARSGDRS